MILGIETSCDDTGVALWDGERLVGDLVYRQAVHAGFGGVIPEWASREHEVRLPLVIMELLQRSGHSWDAIDAVAVAEGPGLLGSLIVGFTFAKALAFSMGVPLIGVNHLEAHIASLTLAETPPPYPFACLVATGGHTHLYVVSSPLSHELVGRTQDDAVGEAFDKVAAWLGLPYPGGPEIEKLASQGDPTAYAFPTPRTEREWDFSFSGLKTAFLQAHTQHPEISLSDLAASWQACVFRYLLEKLFLLAEVRGLERVAIVGGVSANQMLRKLLSERAAVREMEAYVAPLAYAMDNAAMIAVAGWHKYSNGLYTPITAAPYARLREGAYA